MKSKHKEFSSLLAIAERQEDCSIKYTTEIGVFSNIPEIINFITNSKLQYKGIQIVSNKVNQ